MTGIPTQDLTALLDALIGNRLREDPTLLTVWLAGIGTSEPHITMDMSDPDPQHVATLARIAAGENYEHRTVTPKHRDTPNPMPCTTPDPETADRVAEQIKRAVNLDRWFTVHADSAAVVGSATAIWDHPDGRSFWLRMEPLSDPGPSSEEHRYASNEALPHPDPCTIPDCPIHPRTTETPTS